MRCNGCGTEKDVKSYTWKGYRCIKFFCPMNKQCDKDDCSHRKPHHMMDGCNIQCIGRDAGKCIPYVHKEFNLEVKIL